MKETFKINMYFDENGENPVLVVSPPFDWETSKIWKETEGS